MRLMVVGAPDGQLTLAARLAGQNGADTVHADGVVDAIRLVSAGCRADVILIDVALAVGDLVKALETIPRNLPVIACGTSTDAAIALAAIDAGASEYLPLPGCAKDIAAL